jgi:membrane-bound lytic murein transglycosylase D
MQLLNILTAISIVLMLSACQSMGKGTGTAEEQATAMAEFSSPQELFTRRPDPEAKAKKPAEDLWERIRRGLTWQQLHNAQIGRERDRILAQHNYLPLVSDRASLYLYYIVEEVERRGLPMEVALLPLVESLLNPFAYSSEQAAGLWQIMPSTGRYLGLEQDWWFDGRRDLRESTRVALDYLEDLHRGLEGDWLLGLAAYNSGKTRVRRAQKVNRNQGKETDYWSLKLPRETRNYVPRLIALAQIVAYPEAFGVEIPSVPNRPAFEISNTGGQIELQRAAQLAGIELSKLRALNAGHLRWATAPDRPDLLLPIGAGEPFSEGVAALTPEERVRWEYYKIQNGDNLIGIAKAFNTDVALLRQANSIRGSMIRAGDTLMIPKGEAWVSSIAMATSEKPTAKGYRVRRGDSLHRIAGKFNVSVNEIVAWNQLDPGKYLQPGQKLTLYVRGS